VLLDVGSRSGRYGVHIEPGSAARSNLNGLLDGAGVPLNAGGPRPGYITAFGRFGHDLAPGLHVVVAFARASTGAVATAWTFTAPRRVA